MHGLSKWDKLPPTLYINVQDWRKLVSTVCSRASTCKHIHTHTQIYTNLGAAPQSMVGILHQTGQESYVVAKRIEKNWEGLFLVGWKLVRRKPKPKMHA